MACTPDKENCFSFLEACEEDLGNDFCLFAGLSQTVALICCAGSVLSVASAYLRIIKTNELIVSMTVFLKLPVCNRRL